MKYFLIFIFISTFTVCCSLQQLTEQQENVYKKYPHLFCAVCRGAGNGNCRDCPFLEDVDLCGFIDNFESLTKQNTQVYDSKPMLGHLQSSCSDKNGAKAKLGAHLAQVHQLDTNWGKCVICNVVLGAVHFFQNEIFANPAVEQTLDVICAQLDKCTPELIHAVLQGLADSTEGFYNVIGMDLLGCPDLTTFVDDCFGDPNGFK